MVELTKPRKRRAPEQRLHCYQSIPWSDLTVVLTVALTVVLTVALTAVLTVC